MAHTYEQRKLNLTVPGGSPRWAPARKELTMTTISVPARQYEDHDDCLSAAQADYIEAHPELEGWELNPRWSDDQRDEILLDVPDDVRDEDEIIIRFAVEQDGSIGYSVVGYLPDGEMAAAVSAAAQEQLSGDDLARWTAACEAGHGPLTPADICGWRWVVLSRDEDALARAAGYSWPGGNAPPWSEFEEVDPVDLIDRIELVDDRDERELYCTALRDRLQGRPIRVAFDEAGIWLAEGLAGKEG
jgi:hypothetical protein